MTKDNFLNQLEGIINDMETGIMTKNEAISNIMELMTNALMPFVQSKEHLTLFIYRVHKMRELQKQFFAGKKNVVPDSKKAESAVDSAMIKLLGELCYSIENISNKYEQPKLL